MKIEPTSRMTLKVVTFSNRLVLLQWQNLTLHLKWSNISVELTNWMHCNRSTKTWGLYFVQHYTLLASTWRAWFVHYHYLITISYTRHCLMLHYIPMFHASSEDICGLHGPLISHFFHSSHLSLFNMKTSSNGTIKHCQYGMDRATV